MAHRTALPRMDKRMNTTHRPVLYPRRRSATARSGEYRMVTAESIDQRMYHALRGSLRQPSRGRKWHWASTVSEHLDRSVYSLRGYRGEVRGPHWDYEDLCLQSQWMVPRIRKLIATFDEAEANTNTPEAAAGGGHGRTVQNWRTKYAAMDSGCCRSSVAHLTKRTRSSWSGSTSHQRWIERRPTSFTVDSFP